MAGSIHLAKAIACLVLAQVQSALAWLPASKQGFVLQSTSLTAVHPHWIMQACLFGSLAAQAQRVSDNDTSWQTLIHEPGYCSNIGICGHRADKDVLNCPNNTRAPQPSEQLGAKLQATCPTLWSRSGGMAGSYCCTEEQVDKLAADTQKALVFIVGCPACQHNFMELWCTLVCSPDQATFTNVSQVQLAADNNATVIKELQVWTSDEYMNSLFNSCKDVKYGAANLPAMIFIGGGAKTPQQWLEFLGDVKDHRTPPIGSPFQMVFNPEGDDVPTGITPLKEQLPGCGDALFQCSCADCPVAPGCTMPPPGPPPEANHCKVGHISCWEFALIFAYIGLVLASGAAGYFTLKRRAHDKGIVEGSGEPLLAAEWADEEGGDGKEEQPPEPLPGDMHYPWLERQMQKGYTRWGAYVARHPLRVIGGSAGLIVFCLLGLIGFRLETDPQRLWVGPTSQAARDKASFEASFGPFYRVEQLIVSTTPTSASKYTAPNGLPSVVTDANILLMFQMQVAIDAISAPYVDEAGVHRNASLSDICFKPFGDVCAIQSVLQYWHMDEGYYRAEQAKSAYTVKASPDYCFGHWSTQCRSAFQAPIDPHVVLGGFPVGPDFRNYSADATVFVVTYPVDSSAANLPAAKAWEAQFLQLAEGQLTQLAHAANLSLSFSAERSVQDELKRESYTDAGVVAVSYLVMLAYIAVALAALPPARQPLQALVLSRASLGLGGVLIVALSVAGALGLVSMAGLWSTLIIMEVIPFLVLAVGVDNMFVLAHALARQDPSLALPVRMGLALGSAGPSITLAAACEGLAFGLGALTPMPAVRNFSACAACAVMLDFVLQITAFVALLALDTRRLEQRRIDCLPCLRIPYMDEEGTWVHDDLSDDETDAFYGSYTAASVGNGAGDTSDGVRGGSGGGGGRDYGAGVGVGEDDGVGGGNWRLSGAARVAAAARSRPSLQGLLQVYMERVHAPALMKPLVQAVVIAVFVTGLFLSSAAVPHLSVGLDQAVALPRDSYLQPYYRDVIEGLRVGPPLFFVVSDINVTREAGDVDKVCSISGCRQDSLASRVARAALNPQRSFIASGAASWVDDFLSWLNPSLNKCCRAHTDPTSPTQGQRCPPPDQLPCSANASACADCNVCLARLPEGGRPDAVDVEKYLPWFLQAVPSEGCAKGGAGAYSTALQADGGDATGIAGLSRGVVSASHFRTYTTPLNQQSDFINALRAARDFAATASAELGLHIYPYSIFHIFFEQYLNVGRDALLLVGTPCLAVFGVAWAFTGSLWGSALLLLMLGSLLLHLLGAMYLAGIQLNAVSLVNLAMSLGIAVEFCAHILHAFVVGRGSRRARAKGALLKMGASVLSGITLTKFIGVMVLGFAQTQIFEVYYFRLYLALVILGAGHGLVLLPVMLSLIGPPSWSDRQLSGDSPRPAEPATPSAGGSGSGDGSSRRSSSRQIPLMTQPSGEAPGAQGLGRVGSGREGGEQLPAIAAAGVAAAAAAMRGDSPLSDAADEGS